MCSVPVAAEAGYLSQRFRHFDKPGVFGMYAENAQRDPTCCETMSVANVSRSTVAAASWRIVSRQSGWYLRISTANAGLGHVPSTPGQARAVKLSAWRAVLRDCCAGTERLALRPGRSNSARGCNVRARITAGNRRSQH